MRRRSLIHRVTALFSSALLLQLSMLAGSPVCHAHGQHTISSRTHANGSVHGAPESHGAAALQHRGMAAVQETSSPMPHDTCAAMGTGVSCGGPVAPAGCGAMAGCLGATGIAAAATTALEVAPTDAVLTVASATMSPGPAFAPELPPPRA